jgi:uncharacterized cupredoxin-like copper-binding protein
MRRPSAARLSVGLLTAILLGCTSGVSFTPGTAEMPRTVTVAARDPYAFAPDRIPIRPGETVRFVVSNEGQVEHEFVIGTREELVQHAMVMTHGGMREDTSRAIRVIPGQTKELVFTFGSATDLGFACLVPGHYPAGMSGQFEFVN